MSQAQHNAVMEPAPPQPRNHQIEPTDLNRCAQLMLNEIFDFVALLDCEGRVLEANQAALDGAGVTRDEVLGRLLWETRWWQTSNAVAKKLQQAVAQAAKGDQVRFEAEIYGAELGRQPITIDFSLHGVCNDEGKIEYLLAEGWNVSHRRAAADEMARKNTELASLCRQQQQEFDRQKELFLNISHDLRTPLTLIVGPIRRRLQETGLSGGERRDLEIVNRNTVMLLKHVNDLLEVSKLEAGRSSMCYERVDLAKLVRMMASHFESLARERRITFDIQTSERLLAEADADKVQRVLLNLLSNAFKFAPVGGNVWLTLEAGPQTVRLTIEDSGPGVPRDQRQAIFDRFKQAERADGKRSVGAGLGLGIAKQFVELHGGAIEVETGRSGGARFVAEFPLRARSRSELAPPRQATPVDDERAAAYVEILSRPAAIPENDASRPTPPAGAPLVLIVEDNEDMSSFIADTLAADYRIVSAADGREGIDKAIATRPDLIITDVMMPRLPGDRLIVEFRKHRELDNVPIVVLTANADDGLRVKMLKAGAQDLLSKPFFPDELLARVARLIAERFRTEAERARMAAIVESSSDAILSKSLDGVITSWNAGAQRLYGYNAEEIIGQSISVLIPPERRDEVAELLAKLRRGRRVDLLETERVTKTKRRIHVSVSLAPIRDAAGKVVAISSISRDITERRQFVAELREAKEAAEAANKAKDQFLAVLSHELRTPLTPVMAAVSLMRGNSNFPKRLAMELDTIERNVKTEARLIDDLLDLTRISRGKIELHHEAVDAHALLRETLRDHQQNIDEKRLDVSVSLRARRRTVWADPKRLRQIVSNLLGNAVKFTPEEGSLTIRTRDEAPGRTRIEISDTGVGIEAEALPRIFNPFEQGEQTVTRRFGGLGLGLAISKALVDMHGGELTAQSDGRDRGATFAIKLASVDLQQSTAKADSEDHAAQVTEPAAVEHLHVLLVDDHEDTLYTLAKLLEMMQCRVTTASSVAEAQAAADAGEFDLLLSDIGLPDGSGLDIMRHVRNRPGLKGVALSGFGAEEDLRRSTEAGFDHHLTKPVNLPELERVIRLCMAEAPKG